MTVAWLLLLTASFPLAKAWAANRRSSLSQALHWAAMSWAAWLGALLPGGIGRSSETLAYVALSLTACSAVAVLGARRPGVGAWNFVLLGLLAVLALPLLTALTAGRPPHLVAPFLLVLGGTLAVGFLNYLPTRLAPGAAVLATACAAEVIALAVGAGSASREAAVLATTRLLLGVAIWIAYLSQTSKPAPPSAFDRRWLDFRDRYGLVWGQRVREQFNHSAANVHWPVYLRWTGLQLTSAPGPSAATQDEILKLLGALLKRFDPQPPSVDRPEKRVPQ